MNDVARQHTDALPRRDLLRALAGAALCLTALPVLGAARSLTATDLMPDFWDAYDATRPLETTARADALMARFFAPHKADYERAGASPSAHAVAGWLPKFDALEPGVRHLHREFPVRLAAAGDAFRAALPDFDPVLSPLTVLPSLFRFDAHLESAVGQLPLFFGLDGIVRLHGADAHLGILMSHELFHCYQAQCNPVLALKPKTTVCETMWLEGTATYASERLNPGEPLDRVLLDDVALAGMSADALRDVARAALAQFDVDDDAVVARYFDMGGEAPWPARAGYRVGLLAARAIGAQASLKEMAAMPPAEFRPALRRELERLG